MYGVDPASLILGSYKSVVNSDWNARMAAVIVSKPDINRFKSHLARSFKGCLATEFVY